MDFGTYFAVRWVVELGDEFQPEYDDLPEEVQDELLAMDPSSSTIRTAIEATTRRHNEWFAICKYEGVAF
jgi:hypothetical protein